MKKKTQCTCLQPPHFLHQNHKTKTPQKSLWKTTIQNTEPIHTKIESIGNGLMTSGNILLPRL